MPFQPSVLVASTLSSREITILENARTAQDQSDYTARYAAMTQRYDKANQRLAEVEKIITARSAKRQELEAFMRELGSRSELLTCFDEGLWLGIVHQVKVTGAEEFEFVLKGVGISA